MLKEITSLAVIAAIRDPNLLAVHIILNLIVPRSLSVRVVSVNNLQKGPHVGLQLTADSSRMEQEGKATNAS